MGAPKWPEWMTGPVRTSGDYLRRMPYAIVSRLLPVPALRYKAYRQLIKGSDSYLYATGWMQSLRARRPLDVNSRPVPWMNYPVIGFLEERLTKDLSVFEFGSGYSTLFYAARVKSVTSVEYDKRWFDFVQKEAPANVQVFFQAKDADGDYCRMVLASGALYDVVVIDGRDRVNCIKQSIAALSPRGVIVLDDSQRQRYWVGIEHARSQGFRALHLEGLKPNEPVMARTTILYRSGNCLDL